MSIIEILKVLVLGIVEGFTEWLPISSTGHMILVDEIIHLNVTQEFKDVFMVVIQLGAILAVILWMKVVVACVPAAVMGLLFDDWMEAHLMNAYVVAAALILYGILFIVVENINYGKRPAIERVGDITYKTALIIGLFQVLSLVPGTSRSGSTILGAMIIGCSRPAAAEFSFFL